VSVAAADELLTANDRVTIVISDITRFWMLQYKNSALFARLSA
jgi:hypothetical protein